MRRESDRVSRLARSGIVSHKVVVCDFEGVAEPLPGVICGLLSKGEIGQEGTDAKPVQLRLQPAVVQEQRAQTFPIIRRIQLRGQMGQPVGVTL